MSSEFHLRLGRALRVPFFKVGLGFGNRDVSEAWRAITRRCASGASFKGDELFCAGLVTLVGWRPLSRRLKRA